jgi:predicted HicB family RNase H-like nuclease
MATSVTSKNFSGKHKLRDRPFSAAVRSQARRIAARFGVVVRYEPDTEAYAARAIEMPLVAGFADTPQEATREALSLAETTVAYMIEQGEEPPPPGSESPRTEQVNVRVSAEERARMEAAAQRRGLSLVDHVRGSALAVDPAGLIVPTTPSR